MEIRKITSEILDLENFCLGSGAVSINSVSVLSQRHFSTLTSQVSISQMETSQMCNFPSGNFPKVMLGPMRHHRLQWGAKRCGQDGLGADRRGQNKLALLLGRTWEAAAWLITHLGKYPWEVTALEIAHLGCFHLGN